MNIFLATSSLLPYLTIHMQSIGITVEEIAIIYLALPFTTFLAPPITGKKIKSSRTKKCDFKLIIFRLL
jgi:hypothetical protein